MEMLYIKQQKSGSTRKALVIQFKFKKAKQETTQKSAEKVAHILDLNNKEAEALEADRYSNGVRREWCIVCKM